MSTEFLQGLIRQLYSAPEVAAAYLGGDLAQPSAAGLDRIDLYLAAEPGFREGLGDWLAPLGEVAFSRPDPEGWRVITLDGVEWNFRFTIPAATAALQALFDRREGGGDSTQATPPIDLAGMAGRFWADLCRAAKAMGKGRTLTAHGHLEECRRALIDLYRLALAPETDGRGWEGIEGLPGVAPALEQVREWLVAPLDLRAQRRCATRLASAYESLMLPLCQRLGVPYPMAMRKLAFQRLDQARPDRGPEASPPDVPVAEPPAVPSGKLRVAKGRIRRGASES